MEVSIIQSKEKTYNTPKGKQAITSNRNKVRIIITEHFSDRGRTLEEIMTTNILEGIKKSK